MSGHQKVYEFDVLVLLVSVLLGGEGFNLQRRDDPRQQTTRCQPSQHQLEASVLQWRRCMGQALLVCSRITTG